MIAIHSGQDIPTRWSIPQAVQAAQDGITACIGKPRRSVIFIGETHDSAFDKARNLQLAGWVAANPALILIAERNIFNGAVFGPNMHEEANSFSSFDDARNVDAVRMIRHAVATDGNAPRPIVMFYGADHDERIRTRLVRATLGAEREVTWLSCDSAMDAAGSLANHVIPGSLLTGFTNPGNAITQDMLYFLSKGKIAENMPLSLRSEIPYSMSLWALYTAPNFPNQQAIDLNMYDAGTAIINVQPQDMPNATVRKVAHGEFNDLKDQLMARIS